MNIETAAQYCSRIDFEEGEAWSNDYEELAIKMQEYAEYYHQAKLKLLGIDDADTRFYIRSKCCKTLVSDRWYDEEEADKKVKTYNNEAIVMGSEVRYEKVPIELNVR